MRPETAVVEINRKHKVHTEFYGNPAASKTIILVNGSLATTASFAQSVKYLQPQFNVVAFDLPYAGQSKPHNTDFTPITKEDEAAILLHLINHYSANYLMSFSWGGVASMLALAQRPATLEKAAICSFSPILNVPMLPAQGPALPRLGRPRQRRPAGQQHHRQAPAVAVQALQPQARQHPRRT